LTEILAAHHIPYAAQTAPFKNYNDLYTKAQKAIYKDGPSFLNVFTPCPRGWRYSPEKMLGIVELAIDTCFWPLYEVVEDCWTLTYKPKQKKPVEDFLRTQGRFSHLFKPENKNLIKEIQDEVDRRWELLLDRCERS
jgi:pyruvate ferredoxin oxidoreductase beta subunit